MVVGVCDENDPGAPSLNVAVILSRRAIGGDVAHWHRTDSWSNVEQ